MARTTLRIPCWARLRCSDADARGAIRDACHCSRRKNGERRETARERRRGPWRPTGSGGCPGSSPSFRCCPSGSTPRLRQYLGMRWDSMGWDGRQRHLPAGSGFFRAPQWFTRSLFRLCSCGLVCGANWRWCQTAYKPGSVRTAHGFPWRCGTTIHLGRTFRRASRDQPGQRSGNAPAPCGAAVPIRSCSRWGLPCHPCCQGRGALLPRRFALARGPRRRNLHGRFVFCGTFPGVAPAGRYPAPYSLGARTFLYPIPGASPGTSSGRPAVWQSIIGGESLNRSSVALRVPNEPPHRRQPFACAGVCFAGDSLGPPMTLERTQHSGE